MKTCTEEACTTKHYARELCRLHYQHLPERSAQRRDYRLRNKESHKAYKETRRERDRELAYLRKYGITIQEYDTMLEAQGGVCAICAGPSRGGHGVRFHIDHDHVTGQVRGLLCAHCNNMLGRASDSPELLRKAANYLEERKKRG